MPKRSSCACSIAPACRSGRGSSCRNTPTRSGTAICRKRGRSSFTATGYTGPTSRRRATASTRTSCCSTPMRRAMRATSAGATSLFGYRVGSPREDLAFDRRDSARHMPKCRVVETAFTWSHDQQPRTSWEETIILEMHVRGFTMRHPAVPERDRGNFAALASPAVIDYLIELGVTAVELLPVHAAVQRPHPGRARAVRITGATTRSGFSRPIRAFCRPARSPSSRPRSSGCTRPASR